MLTITEITALFDRLGTPRKGRELILRARTEAPVRDVQSRGGNVITLLASRKMSREIRTESRHIEFAAAVDHEYAPQVLEYYAQPCELKLELIDTNSGEIRNIHHFPDFLVIRDDAFTLEEWKPESRLARLAEKYPYRYVKGTDSLWTSPQIEEKLAELGIAYRILTEAAIPRKRVENLLHLADYFHPAAEPCPPTELARLKLALQEHGSVYVAELLAAPYSFSSDALYKAIADNQVVVDLDRDTLTQPLRSRLYRDTTLRDFMAANVHSGAIPGQERFVLDIAPGAVFQYESQELTISLVGEKEVVCTLRDGASRTLSKDWLMQALDHGRIAPVAAAAGALLDISRYSQAELNIALQRQGILQRDSVKVSARTQRRWSARQTAAMANSANEVLALVPHTAARGNRSVRLTEEQDKLLQEIIVTKWRSHEAQNFKSCYRALVVACDDAKIKPPSYPTLIERIKSQETNQDSRIRHGKRMAYQMKEYVDVLNFDTPVHGCRSFQYVHIDHTQLDLESKSSRTGKPLGRPWLTFAVDAWSRRIVGFYLTFDPPSYHSVMMLIRDMVRRFGRLPEFVIVDNGRDLISAAFRSFLLVMSVHMRFRPAGQPRHGAVMERVFGRCNTEYIHNLAGNTKATKHVRMVTGKHLPVNFADWTLENMYYGLEFWAMEYYEQERHPALDCSPREAFQRGLKESGARPQRQILFNQDFLIATCPPVDREGIRQVHRQNGVKVNDMYYWNAQLRDPSLVGQRLPVRYDPWDAASVYVRIKDRWVHARCRSLLDLGQLTDVERRALTEEYSNRSGNPGDDERARQRLREFMQVFTPEGAMQAAFERQSENKALYNNLQLGSINPVAQPLKVCLDEEIQKVPAPAAEIRPLHNEPPPMLNETSAAEDLPDFDTF